MITNNDDAKNYLMEHRTSEAISSRITEKYFEDTFLTGVENVDYTGGCILIAIRNQESDL